MKQYHKHLEDILSKGSRKEPAREGMPGSISLFGYQNRYDLSQGFPILTTKKVNFKNIVVELLWFLKGDTNIKYLVDNGCNIWNEDAYNYYKKRCNKYSIIPIDYTDFVRCIKQGDKTNIEYISNYKLGDCGKQYGWLWRNWSNYPSDNYIPDSTDQIKALIEGLKSNPMGRRHIISAWNPATLDAMALNACHAFVQFNVRPIYHKFNPKVIANYYLDCQLYQRSADMFLGVPYNIASYALLTELIARICNMVPGEFIHTFGDSHIYDNHIDQVKELLSRDPDKYELPNLWLDTSIDWQDGIDIALKEIESFGDPIEQINVINYQHYPAIKAKLSTGLK